jgi:hypothetical protein
MADETGMSSGISVDSAFLGAEEEVSVDRLTEDLDPVTKYALTMMEDAWAHAEDANREAHDKIARIRKLYVGDVTRKRNYKGLADLWPNVVFEAIDSQVPVIFRSLFPDLDFFEIEAQGEEGLKDDTVLKRLAKLHVSLMQRSLEDMQFMGKAIKALRYCAKFGTMILMPYWNLRRAKVRSQKTVEEPLRDSIGNMMFDETGKPAVSSRVVPTYVEAVVSDSADAVVIDPEDFFPGDPMVSDLRSMDFVARRFDATMNKLLQQEARDDGYGYYRNLDLLEKAASGAKDPEGGKTEDVVSTRPEKLGKDVTCVEIWFAPGIFDPASADGITEADIAEFCDFWRVDPADFEGGWVMTLADKRIPIRIEPNPYKIQEVPFLTSRFYEIDDQFWGMGIAELVESYQFEIADKRNQAMDAVTRALRSRWLFSAEALEDRKDPLKFLSGEEDYLAINSSNAPGGVSSVAQELVTRINPQYPFQAAQEAKIDMQSMTGTSNTSAGAESFNRSTATEVNAREQAGMSRIELRVMEQEFAWVTPFLQWLYRLNDQFYDRKKAIKFVGEAGVDWENLQDEDFTLDLKFTPKGSRLLANKMSALTQIVQLTANPAFAQFINAPELLEDIFRLLLRMPDPKRYILNPNIPHIPVSFEAQEELFIQGHSSDVDPQQDLNEGAMELQRHIQMQGQRSTMGASSLEMRVRERHIQMHGIYLSQMAAAQQQQMAQAQAQQQGTPPNAKQPERETGPGAPDPGGMGREMVANGQQ